MTWFSFTEMLKLASCVKCVSINHTHKPMAATHPVRATAVGEDELAQDLELIRQRIRLPLTLVLSAVGIGFVAKVNRVVRRETQILSDAGNEVQHS
jgi:hypothetical protein